MQYDVPYMKIASACMTDKELLSHCIETKKPLLISTGMADLSLIKTVVKNVRDMGGSVGCLYHCVSTYPSRSDELNLLGIQTLKKEFPDIPIGYSGHEVGVATTVMAAVLGAVSVERHITLDRAMWGSDQAASLELPGLSRLVRDIRVWEIARGDSVINMQEREKPIESKLRRKHTIFEAPKENQGYNH
jgi:N-acetylneuraminate synthase